mgnify:CR=1 FL=1
MLKRLLLICFALTAFSKLAFAKDEKPTSYDEQSANQNLIDSCIERDVKDKAMECINKLLPIANRSANEVYSILLKKTLSATSKENLKLAFNSLGTYSNSLCKFVKNNYSNNDIAKMHYIACQINILTEFSAILVTYLVNNDHSENGTFYEKLINECSKHNTRKKQQSCFDEILSGVKLDFANTLEKKFKTTSLVENVFLLSESLEIFDKYSSNLCSWVKSNYKDKDIAEMRYSACLAVITYNYTSIIR